MSENDPEKRTWLLPAGLVALVVTLVVVALTRGPVELDPDTPEGTVQEYLSAIDEERWEDAVAVVHPQWLGECTAGDLSRFANFDFTAQLGQSDDGSGPFGGVVVQERFEEIGDDGESLDDLPIGEIQVEVTITRGDVGPFGSGWDEYVVFELADEDDFWWITGDPWPYFIWNCRA